MTRFSRRLLRLLGRSVDVLTGLLEWLLRGRWLIIRMVGAVADAIGLDSRIGRASVAFRRLPALMRRSVGTSDHPQVAVYGRTPVVTLRGTPEEMGRQYGSLMREPLQALAASIESAIPARLQRRLLELTHRAEPHLPDSVRQEIRAIADAADVRYDLLATMNTTTRIACTTIAARDPGGHVVMGRNGDSFGMGFGERAMAVVVRRPNQGHATISVNFLGMVGAFTGINDQGVAFGNMVVLNAGTLLKSDILLAPHHGSKSSCSKHFLEMVRPNICIISSGSGNYFRFPHSETLDRLKQTGCRIIRTDRVGAVQLYASPDRLEINSFLN